MSKLIQVLMVLSFSFLFIIQCKESVSKYIILCKKENPYYSFYIKDNKSVFYGKPYKGEKPILISKNQDLLFDDYLTQFTLYNLPIQTSDFDDLFVSVIVGETNFITNNQFEYEMGISKKGIAKVNIFYPDEFIGSYEISLDSNTRNMIGRATFKLNSLKTNTEDISNLSNVIIINDNAKESVFGGENIIFNSPEYSLILILTNKILLEKIHSNTIKIKKIDFAHENYVKHITLPPSPPRQGQ